MKKSKNLTHYLPIKGCMIKIYGKNMKRSIISGIILAAQILNVSADSIKGVLEELPEKDKYGYIKKNSDFSNIDVFKQYEAQKSDKIIFICIPSFITFKLHAFWNIDRIKNKIDAEKFAADICAENASGFVLLGYSIRTNYKF
jgi:hypothetical protein